MSTQTMSHRPVYLVDGARTPFLKAKGKTGPFTGSDLAVAAGRSLLARQTFTPENLDEVILGSAMPGPDEANIARVVALRLGCGHRVPGWTVMRNCASGLQSIDNAFQDIRTGRHNLVLAGGTDSMSHAPLLFRKAMVDWLGAWYGVRAKGVAAVAARARLLAQFRPAFFAPIIALLRGLTDPVVGINMGQTAERIAYQFGITREQMDAFAQRSQERAYAGQQAKHFEEIIPIFDHKGRVYELDDGVRSDSNVEKLGKLRPVFDKKFGKVTAGNSSQVTDGSAMLILASEDAVKKYDLPVKARIVDVEWAALDPADMGYGPIFASTPLLARNQLSLNDVDCWEINEAFAGQVLACLAAWNDDEFCQQRLGLTKKVGELDQAKLNIDGGAIAIGHPIGASGSRLVLHVMNTLQREQARYGIATLCIGGGQGGAMLIERVDGIGESR